MTNLFKQDNGFGASIFIGINNTIPIELENQLITVDDEIYQQLLEHKLMWNNGSLVVNPNYEEYIQELKSKEEKKQIKKRIKELKQLLFETDYRAIKYAEGLYTEEEYAPYKYQRQAYRDEINRLESLIL